jgi:DNA (cytosine-5)-methyltransferase 1
MTYSKNIDMFEHAKPKRKSTFSFIDLFAGIGGTRLALERNGGECVFSSEWDVFCQKTYLANFGEVPAGDITKINEKKIPDFDILVAGFPCQPFSTMGKRQGFLHETQGTLFYDVARIIKAKRPKAFLLENVPGLTTHNKGNTFKTILSVLDKLNYETFHTILNASDFGVPQKRKRIYIVGFDREEIKPPINYSFPKGTKNKIYINQFIEDDAKGYPISEHLQKTYLFKENDGRPEIINKSSKIHVKTLVASYHKIQRLTGTFVRGGETGIRLLTANECKAIMGFDKDFIIPVSRTQMYRQLGNSVAIPVVQAVAHQIVEMLKGAKIKLNGTNK